MTLHLEGSIDGRPFAAKHDDAGAPSAWVCLAKLGDGSECLAETAPDVAKFARHKCGKKKTAAPAAKKKKGGGDGDSTDPKE